MGRVAKSHLNRLRAILIAVWGGSIVFNSCAAFEYETGSRVSYKVTIIVQCPVYLCGVSRDNPCGVIGTAYVIHIRYRWNGYRLDTRYIIIGSHAKVVSLYSASKC